MKTILVALLLVFVASCSHQREKAQLEETLSNLQCKDTLKKDPFRSFADASVETTEYLGKKALAYSYIVGNYTAEVLWDATAGTVLFVGLCSPAIVSMIAKNAQGGTAQYQCFTRTKNMDSLLAPPLGRQSVKNTKSWRCPDNEPLLETLQKVIACQSEQDTSDHLNKALQTLDNLESSRAFYDCLTDPQKLTLQEQRASLQKRLADLESPTKTL